MQRKSERFSDFNPEIPVGVAYFVISEFQDRTKQGNSYKIGHLKRNKPVSRLKNKARK